MKPYEYNEEQGLITLRTQHTMYQMQIMKHGYLGHLYYGPEVGDMDMSYRITYMDHGFCPNPPEAQKDRTFSLDCLPLEYSSFGNGDYRDCSLLAVSPSGDASLSLKYQSHQVKKGKYSLPSLPAMFAKEEEEAITLEVTLMDQVTRLKVILLYGVFSSLDVITRAVRFENAGEGELSLEKALSMQIDSLDKHYDLIHFDGRHCMERIPGRTPLTNGEMHIGSTRGSSSHQHNPFVILCDHGATEEHGSCYGFTFVYSGNFLAQAEVDQFGQTRFAMGIHPEGFSWKLSPGESFHTPEVILSYSDQGLEGLTDVITTALRSNLMRSPYVFQSRPILVNNWEATYFTFDEEKLFSIAKDAKELGLDLFVLDDGWFGHRDNDYAGLGDWVVNEEKLKGGLSSLSQRIHSLGLKLGLWIEPEMISEDSDLYRTHPDYCLKIPGREPIRGRYQLNLDITREEVRRAVMEPLCSIIEHCHISYVKWDFNRNISNVYSATLGSDRQGEVLHRYVLGLYQMQETLVSRFPNLLLENCAGGGGRFDAGLLYYSPQIWCSDNTDAIDRLSIQYGTSFGYPVSTMGSHISAVPNHQTGRVTPFETRALVATVGTFGFELVLGSLTPEEKALAKKWIAIYRQDEELMQRGRYLRLTNPFTDHNFVSWELVSRDQRRAVVSIVILRSRANTPISYVYPRGLNPRWRYREETSGKIYTGAALMMGGLSLPITEGDYQPLRYSFVAE